MQSSSTLGASSIRPTSLSRLQGPRPAAKALVSRARYFHQFQYLNHASKSACGLEGVSTLEALPALSLGVQGACCLRRQGTVWAATGQSGQSGGSGGLSREEARAKQTGVTRGGSTTSSTGTPGGVQPSSYAASPESRGLKHPHA